MLVFKVMISSSKISKNWVINGNVDKGKISPILLKASKNVVIGQILVRIKFKVVWRKKGLSRQVEMTLI